MSYSTGTDFYKALADAESSDSHYNKYAETLTGYNDSAFDDLEAIKVFIYQHTGFRVTQAMIKGHNELEIKVIAKQHGVM